MKILESQSATLSNPEVLSHLNFLEARRQKNKPSHATVPPLKSPNYETVIKELADYLSPSDTHRFPLPPYNPPAYTPSKIKALIHRLKPYDLTKAELLMITNLKPQDPGFLDCVIEECDMRFSAEEQEDILRIVGECIGGEGEGMEVENGISRGGKENGNGVRNGETGGGSKPVEMEVDGGEGPNGRG